MKKSICLSLCILLIAILAGCETSNQYNKISKTFVTISTLTTDNHSFFLDDVNSVKESWENSGYVNVDGEYNEFDIVGVQSNSQTKLIDDIQIYFSKINSVVTLDNVIEIVNEYIPKDIIQTYYQKQESFVLTSTEDTSHYFYIYELRESAKRLREEQTIKYPFEIVIQIDKKNNDDFTLWLHTDVPNWAWESNMTLNNFDKEEWNIEF